MLSTHEAGGYHYRYPHPAVAADIAIFTVREGRLMLLLIKRLGAPFAGQWALPGGFLSMDEDLDSCARRELLEETGVDTAFLEHFGNFSAPDRDPRERVISVAYLALIGFDKLSPKAGSDAAEVGWFELSSLPALAFDHDQIIQAALKALQSRVNDLAMLLHLMPERFTLSQLQQVYEIICSNAVDKRNFRARLLETGLIVETEEMERGAHRPARLYKRAGD